jgi:hypothetical protein
MAYYIINTNSTSTSVLANGDVLTVVGGVDLDTLSANAIYGTGGGMNVNIIGNVYGDYSAFFDNSSVGGNRIVVAAAGSMLSQNVAVASYGGSNSLNNAGMISANVAVDFLGSNNIYNSGTITGTQRAIQLLAGSNTIYNTGNIGDSSSTGNDIYITGNFNNINNYGSIVGGYTAVGITDTYNNIVNGGNISGTEYGIQLTGTTGGSYINNSGTISGYYGVLSQEAYTNVVNSGTIAGNYAALYLEGSNLTVTNTGTLSGSSYGAVLTGADDSLTNSGHIAGSVYFGSGASVYDGTLGSVSGTIYDGAGTNAFTGGAGSERFSATIGAFSIDAGGGNDVILAGGNLTPSQQIDGGAGTDTVVLNGDYSAGLTFSDTTMTNVEILKLLGAYNYSLTMDDATVAAGQRLRVDASALGSANSLKLDASAETDGYYSINGGAGADTFTFDPAHFSRADIIQGGAGPAIDTLRFSTAGSISAASLANTSGIEKIALANGTNSLTLPDALVGSANGGLLTVVGGNGQDTINASAVGAAHRVIFDGGGGADTMTAGAGVDYFLYNSASESTGPNYDTIANINFSQDKLNVPGINPITGIDAAVTSGALSTATFNSDLAAAITAGKLGAHHAVEFTASSGTLAGQTFLIADLNGTAGYQANADLVVHLTGATGTLATTTFI